jgi:hypothetical protein
MRVRERYMLLGPQQRSLVYNRGQNRIKMPVLNWKSRIILVITPFGVSLVIPKYNINTRLSLIVTCRNLEKLIKYEPGIKLSLKKKFKLEINASYVFLEQDIREKFARSRHEYLVQTKKCYEYSINTPKDEIALDYENPCKEMSWFYMDQKIKDSKDY